LDTHCTDSEMVDSMDGSYFFVGDAVPDEEAQKRWPHRYRSNHCLLKKVGMQFNCYCSLHGCIII
jgi:DNA (cytosine-5)-methyltransferase 1